MAVDLEEDPLTKVYRILRKMAEESALVRSLVRPSNRIWYDIQSDLTPEKPEVSQGDMPELSLIPTVLTAKLRSNSSSSYALMRYEWWISTGQESIANAILPVTFALYCAMANWPQVADDPKLLNWRGERYITRIDLADANFGIGRPEQNRGIKGWANVWACEVEMYFRTSYLIENRSRTKQ